MCLHRSRLGRGLRFFPITCHWLKPEGPDHLWSAHVRCRISTFTQVTSLQETSVLNCDWKSITELLFHTQTQPCTLLRPQSLLFSLCAEAYVPQDVCDFNPSRLGRFCVYCLFTVNLDFRLNQPNSPVISPVISHRSCGTSSVVFTAKNTKPPHGLHTIVFYKINIIFYSTWCKNAKRSSVCRLKPWTLTHEISTFFFLL